MNPTELYQMYETSNCDDDKFSSDCNKFLLRKEFLERKELGENPELNSYLYPNLNDPNFIVKIAEKKEFQDAKYDGTVYDIKERAEILAKADFELSPHQMFVRNFLSSQTPYNSLLLFHGLGSGKTCSAIGVCEEYRDYMKSFGIKKRIIIVASPNVQDNFRLQLFDERKLKETPTGSWTMRGCIANKLLKEINPMNMGGIPKEKLVSQIKTLINSYYLFLGYVEFSNYITKTENLDSHRKKYDSQQRKPRSGTQLYEKNLRNEFNDRLIVIDEIHNIRDSEEGDNKVVATNLMNLIKKAENIRLLLLSATPMYNSYKEVIWLLNLMNLNDRRASIEIRDIFDKRGKFKVNATGEEIGKELLIRKATGYVSFVRGDNPYTFPFRIYPVIFSPEHTFEVVPYPKYQMNGKKMDHNEEFRMYEKMLQTFVLKIGRYQTMGYKYVIDSLRNREMSITTKLGQVRKMPSFEEMDSFGYHLLRVPLEALIIVYPIENLENEIKRIIPISQLTPEEVFSLSESYLEDEFEPEIEVLKSPSNEPDAKAFEYEPTPTPNSIVQLGGEDTDSEVKESYINASELTGKRGLKRVMNYTDTVVPPIMGDFEYKSQILRKYGRIFSPDEIGKYSTKIKNVCNNVMSSEGVILIYSEYIPGGVIPMALALEELGFRRHGEKSKNLFKDPPVEPIDSSTMKPRLEKSNKIAKYIMITGNPRISPNNDADIKAATSLDNKDGHKIKVIIISRAGSEGVDFKFIRQVHILEPWYNMNRIEQIIGRAVRNFSHKDLPFEKRNVQLFMYGTELEDNEEESADMYVYRAAYYKARQIGNVTRVLKETSVDCLINHAQVNFSQESMGETVEQILSDGKILKDFVVGDAPYSAACDYMESCDYQCFPDKKIENFVEDTYNEAFITMNSERILQKIRMLMKERFFYKKNELLKRVNIPKPYPLAQIYAALTQLVEDSSEFITDKYGRTGYLINIDDYYLFQPSELNNNSVSIFDRSVPIDYKHASIHIDISQKEEPVVAFVEPVVQETSGERLLDSLKKQFQTAIDYARTTEKITRGDEDWYKHCGVTMKKMIKEGFNEIIILECLIDHICDMIPFEEKIELYNYYYRFKETLLSSNPENSFEFMLFGALEKNVIKTTRFSAVLLYSTTKRHIMIWDEVIKKWINAEPEDELEVGEKLAEKFDIKSEKFSDVVGFIGYEHKNRYLVFKVKEMKVARTKGARCDESVKSKKIKILNEIVGREKYNKENTRGAVQSELCSLQELLLRYFNKEKKENKMWFLTFELAMIYKF